MHLLNLSISVLWKILSKQVELIKKFLLLFMNSDHYLNSVEPFWLKNIYGLTKKKFEQVCSIIKGS